MASDRDHKLGMDRDISRRDFLNGVAATSAAAFLPARLLGLEGTGEYAPEKAIDYNPAALTGMRGSGYPGAFKVGHAMRDGVYWPGAPAPIDTHEEYDLIIVGAGISGLSAAYFYRQAEKAGKRILILDNHDDFGGHAKRNQFEYKGDVRISNAGTFWIEGEYGETSTRLLAELGIDAAKIYKENTNPGFYSSLGMGQGVFFDKETWGQDKLLPDPAPWTDFVAMYEPTVPPDQAERWKKFMAEAPMPEHVKQDLYRLYNDKRDYLPGLTVEQKIEKLSEIKYPEFVTTIAGCDPMVLTYLRDRTFGDGTGLDQLRAIHANGYMPGLQGLNIPHVEDAGTYTHFPDGNATIARLLVRRLIPAALPGTTLEDSILAKVNYAALDVAESPVKIRLNSTIQLWRSRGHARELGGSFLLPRWPAVHSPGSALHSRVLEFFDSLHLPGTTGGPERGVGPQRKDSESVDQRVAAQLAGFPPGEGELHQRTNQLLCVDHSGAAGYDRRLLALAYA
jgi:spermidine dehydrogenase